MRIEDDRGEAADAVAPVASMGLRDFSAAMTVGQKAALSVGIGRARAGARRWRRRRSSPRGRLALALWLALVAGLVAAALLRPLRVGDLVAAPDPAPDYAGASRGSRARRRRRRCR